MKESGIGREGSKYGIEDYLEVKSPLHGRHRPLKDARSRLWSYPWSKVLTGLSGGGSFRSHRWAVDQGLRGAPAEMLFDEFCRRW